jgi:hypothetical protein
MQGQQSEIHLQQLQNHTQGPHPREDNFQSATELLLHFKSFSRV